VITCNRCGKQIPAGAAICSNCGVPVSSSGRGNMDAQEQPALPTWLESLRANERPRTPASGQSFSTSDRVGCGLSMRKWRKMSMAVSMARRARLLCLRQIQMPVCHLPEDFRPVHWSIQHLSLPGYRKTSQQRKGREVVRTSQEKHKPHFPPPV